MSDQDVQEIQDAGTPAEAVDAGGADESEQASAAPERAVFPAVDAATEDVDAEGVDEKQRVQLLRDVTLKVRVEFGRGRMLLEDLLRLANGSVVELEKVAGDPLDIFVDNQLIARGEVLVLDERFCIRITEILTPEDCLRVKAG